MSALDALLAELADAVADRVVAKLTAGERKGVDQSKSPLGRRRHIAAVRRRVANGEQGAAVVGRRHFLTQEALESELAAVSKKPRPARAAEQADELAALRERFGLQKAG